MSGGRLLRGIAHAQRALEARLRLNVETLLAWVRDLESAATAREGYVQKEIAKVLARERERWQSDHKGQIEAMEMEWGQQIAETTLL